MSASSLSRRQGAHLAAHLWLTPCLFMLIVGVYFVARYEGRWAEADSASFTQYMSTVFREGTLLPDSGSPYPNGYAYQGISAFILSITGLSAPELQQLIYPLVAALVVLPAWLLFREWTGSARGAAIGSMLLFTQPEFLFVILRSSHEKFTRALLLLCLFWLTRSFKLRDRPWPFALHVGLFYLSAYGLIASNNLLAHSFIFSIGCALVLMMLIERRRAISDSSQPFIQRLPYVIVISLGITYLFTFYLYPPAQHDLLVLHDVWQKLAALLLDVQFQRVNPYETVRFGWVSLQVYFLISIANWLLLGSSFVIWARQGLRWLRDGMAGVDRTHLLVWLFYGAFAAQGALTAVTDSTGALSSNLQHRIFSSFSIFAVGVVAIALAGWRPRRFSLQLRAGVAAAIACIALLSTLKAMNEPLLSNKWTFYRGSELTAMEWSDQHLRGRRIWTEFDERLEVAYLTANSDQIDGARESVNKNSLVSSAYLGQATSFVVSDVARLRGLRLQQPLPVPIDAQRVYDNGSAELYHTRPKTPYQR